MKYKRLIITILAVLAVFLIGSFLMILYLNISFQQDRPIATTQESIVEQQ